MPRAVLHCAPAAASALFSACRICHKGGRLPRFCASQGTPSHLGAGDDVGFDVKVLVAPRLAGAAHSRLSGDTTANPSNDITMFLLWITERASAKKGDGCGREHQQQNYYYTTTAVLSGGWVLVEPQHKHQWRREMIDLWRLAQTLARTNLPLLQWRPLSINTENQATARKDTSERIDDSR